MWRVYNEPLKVQIIKLDGSGGTSIFTDELEVTQFNTNRSHKNWLKRRAAKRRTRGDLDY